MVPPLPTDPQSVPYSPLPQIPAPPCSHFLDLAVPGKKKKNSDLPTPGPLHMLFTSTWNVLLPSQHQRVNDTHPCILLLQPGYHKTASLPFWSTCLSMSFSGIISFWRLFLHLLHEIRNHSTACHYIPRVTGTQ